jgi:pimeloyl-ACP methyl ester carboxylesterase
MRGLGANREETCRVATDSVDRRVDTIVLIHGQWVTARSWEHWIARYRARGYTVLAPNWPGMDCGLAPLRGNPSAVATVGVVEVVDHYDQLIRQLDQAPIIIGHSVGGLAVQQLVDRGLGAAGVTIDGAPAKGVRRLTLSTLRVALPALGELARGRGATTLTPKQFHYAFTNTLEGPAAAEMYERYHAPGPNRAVYQVAFANLFRHEVARVDFRRELRAPLLFVAGGKDNVFPAPTIEANYRLYSKSPAVTSFKEFSNRSHYSICEPGWEEVADFVLTWAMENAVAGT